MSAVDYCVCVPARNEAARLAVLMGALAAQTIAGEIAVALCINNSDDDSAACARALQATHVGRLAIGIEEVRFPAEDAHAGSARGAAMEAGYRRIAGRGVLLSTDADCRPPEGWIAGNLAAIAAGADLVGGRIVLDEAEPVGPAMLAIRARLDRYWETVRGIEDAIDPCAWDAPPRHGDHTGASLAMDAALYRRAGGVPAIPCGEDRQLVMRAVGLGGRLVHPVAVWTRTSPRTAGRAAGGMATAMSDLARTIETGAVPMVPAFEHWRARAMWRRDRRALGAAVLAAEEATLPPMPCDMPLPPLASAIAA